METQNETTVDPVTVHWIAFEGYRCLAKGEPEEVAAAVKERIDAGLQASILVFDAATARPVEFDTRGSTSQVVQRVRASLAWAGGEQATAREDAAKGPGRKKLGVVAREITLLPRHWAWLADQPGGASAAIRRLVDKARTENADADRQRVARDTTYRFMSAIGGDLPGFEEISRALFAGDRSRFEELLAKWPADIVEHARFLARNT